MTSLFACGRFSKSRGLSASVSSLPSPSPSPPSSFTHSIHRRVILCSRTAQKRLLRRLLGWGETTSSWGETDLGLENSVNIWNLLWLSRRLINSTENKSIYINSFPNAPTSKTAHNHEMSTVYIFFNKLDLSLVSRTYIIWKFKMLWFPNEASY